MNGTNYITDRYVALAGTLSFLAGDVVVPPQQGTDPPLLSSPFQMTGRIVGYAPGDVDGITPLFDVIVAGAGTARLRLVPQGDGTFAFPEASYAFEGSDPIPEPATILLTATGLAGVLMRARRRRTAA